MIGRSAGLEMTSIEPYESKEVVGLDSEQVRGSDQSYEICVGSTPDTMLKMRFCAFSHQLDLFKLDHDLPLSIWRHRFLAVVIKSVRFTDHLAGMTLPRPGGGNL
jgi:hypothetical protein